MSPSPAIAIKGRQIGPGHPTYFVAEMSANHLQDLNIAVQIIQAAKEAGADAVKLQTYTPDALTLKSNHPSFQIKGNQWEGRTLYDLYAEAAMPYAWHETLIRVAKDLDIALFSSPFDLDGVAFLSQLDMPAYKIASFENVDIPLIQAVARTGKPVIMSTGMAELGEIDEAVSALRAAGNTELILLKCTSAYPALPQDANLRCIPHLAETFGVVAGLSDHTMGVAVPIAAVTLGAAFIEKHLTLSRSLGGADASFSLEPAEFKSMVDAVRIAEQALGQIQYGPSSHEVANRAYRRSLFVAADIQAGEVLSAANIRSVRPADGLHTRYYAEIIGKLARCDLKAGTPLCWEHIKL